MKSFIKYLVASFAAALMLSAGIAFADDDPLPGAPVCNGYTMPGVLPQCGADNEDCAPYDACGTSGGWYGPTITYCCKDSQDPGHHTGCSQTRGRWKCCDLANDQWKKVCDTSFAWTAGFVCNTVSHACE